MYSFLAVRENRCDANEKMVKSGHMGRAYNLSSSQYIFLTKFNFLYDEYIHDASKCGKLYLCVTETAQQRENTVKITYMNTEDAVKLNHESYCLLCILLGWKIDKNVLGKIRRGKVYAILPPHPRKN